MTRLINPFIRAFATLAFAAEVAMFLYHSTLMQAFAMLFGLLFAAFAWGSVK